MDVPPDKRMQLTKEGRFEPADARASGSGPK